MPIDFLFERACFAHGLLLAVDIGAVIQALVIIVPVVFWILSSILGVAQAKKPPVRKPRQPRPVAKNRPPELAQEIERFLRRAAEQRQGKPPAQVEVLVPAAPVERREVRSIPPVRAEVVFAEPIGPETDGAWTARHEVAEHVDKDLDTTGITQHADQLGDNVARADDKLETRLHKTFDHRLGSLRQQGSIRPNASGDAVGATDPRAPLTAGTLASMLSNPRTARQAVILSEILRRPQEDE